MMLQTLDNALANFRASMARVYRINMDPGSTFWCEHAHMHVGGHLPFGDARHSCWGAPYGGVGVHACGEARPGHCWCSTHTDCND